ncbi:MAG TPA: hypothetical protein VM533_00595 [Fimbriiglobus sp.]|jgi:hypothetical protein|nr:hypothetical protein [Fimbriiglobus sp.]
MTGKWLPSLGLAISGAALAAMTACSGPTDDAAPSETGTASTQVEKAAPSRLPDEVRAEPIRATIAQIRVECQRNAGGDWGRWVQMLEPYRSSLRVRVQEAKTFDPMAKGYFEARSPVLQAKDDFPLFECAPKNYLHFVLDPESLEPFRKERSVAAASRWLKQKGIDLVFVPVPKMTEVYPEKFADGSPADRIIAPQVRRLWLELLEADVEVVDLLPTFLVERDAGQGYLYLPADPHWAPRAHAIGARVVADRLKRYDFVSRAQTGPPICRAVEMPFTPIAETAGYAALNPEQRVRAEKAHPKTHTQVANLEGKFFHSTQSPVLVIGNSYNAWFRDLLGKELNTALHYHDAGGQTTEAFGDMLRDPDMLKDVKVVVWVTTHNALDAFKPLPKPIREAAGAK